MALDITRRFKARSSSSHFAAGVLRAADGDNLVVHENDSGDLAVSGDRNGDDSGTVKKTEREKRKSDESGHGHGQKLASAAAEGVAATATGCARRE